MSNKPIKTNPKIVLLVTTAFLMFFCYRLWVIAPKFFPVFFLCCIGAVGLFISYRHFSSIVFPLCPKCNEVMDIYIKSIIFMGADNAEGKKSFSPIALEQCYCPKCDNVHQRLRYRNSVGGDARDFYIYRNSTEISKKHHHFNMNMTEEFKKGYYDKAITQKQYDEMLKDFQDKVIRNNAKAGFSSNPKDIKLK